MPDPRSSKQVIERLQRALDNTDPAMNPDITISRGGIELILSALRAADEPKAVPSRLADWLRHKHDCASHWVEVEGTLHPYSEFFPDEKREPCDCGLSAALAAEPPKDAFLIFYDDQDRRPEVFWGHGAEEAARRRFEQISGQWNAHLFARVAVNSRDAVTKGEV